MKIRISRIRIKNWLNRFLERLPKFLKHDESKQRPSSATSFDSANHNEGRKSDSTAVDESENVTSNSDNDEPIQTDNIDPKEPSKNETLNPNSDDSDQQQIEEEELKEQIHSEGKRTLENSSGKKSDSTAVDESENVTSNSDSDEPIQTDNIDPKESSTNESLNPNIDDSDQQQDYEKEVKAPIKAGGRRKPNESSGKNTESGLEKQPPKCEPELICRKSESKWQWEIFLSAPEECSIKNIRHDEINLTVNDSEHCLTHFSGILTALMSDGTSYEYRLLEGNKPLIFKTQRGWNGNGKLIPRMTQGSFIVITPNTWGRKKNPPYDPENCSNPDYKAHFFLIDKNNLESQTDGFSECEEIITQPKFKLEGERLADNSNHGELYITRVPDLTTKSAVCWARVGEEAGVGWKGVNFEPSPTTSLKGVLDGRNGHFFVRVYENLGEERVSLVDTDQFRYCAELSKIILDEAPFIPGTFQPPSPEGYNPVTLHFVGKDGTTLKPELNRANRHIDLKDDGKAIINPSPDSNKTYWNVCDVEVVVNLGRIWWQLSSCDDPTVWHDSPLRMTKSNFRTHALNNVRINFHQNSLEKVYAGFNADSEPQIKIKDGLNLAEFLDYKEFENLLTDHVELRIRNEEVSITLIRVTTDPPVKLPQVKNGDGQLRNGKGFSKGELLNAGLSKARCNALRISVDCRRRSIHNQNIDNLKRIEANA